MKQDETPIDETQVQQDIVSTLVDEPVDITIDITPNNKFEALLMRLGIKQKQKHFTLKAITVGNIYRIAAKAVTIPEINLKQDLTEAIMGSFAAHADDIVYIVAVGMQNNKREPKKALMRLIRDEFTMVQIVGVLSKVLIRVNMEAFLSTILLIKGANALRKGSPIDGRE